MRAGVTGILSRPKRPNASMRTPIASCPAMRRPMVANVPIRGAVNVIEVTTIAPMTPPSQSQAGSRTLWPRLPTPCRAIEQDGADDERAP